VYRVHKVGKDSRFDKIQDNQGMLFAVWTIQVIYPLATYGVEHLQVQHYSLQLSYFLRPVLPQPRWQRSYWLRPALLPAPSWQTCLLFSHHHRLQLLPGS
jgi:hypothetical protein